MLRIKGKTLKEQLAELKKDPGLALTTGRPLDLPKSEIRPDRVSGLRPVKEAKSEPAKATPKAKAKKK